MQTEGAVSRRGFFTAQASRAISVHLFGTGRPPELLGRLTGYASKLAADSPETLVINHSATVHQQVVNFDVQLFLLFLLPSRQVE